MSALTPADLPGLLEMLHTAERLKHAPRSAWTATGTPESVAAHTWRMALLAILLIDAFPGVELGHLLQLCIVHDLGEAISGDIPAPQQGAASSKTDAERQDLHALLAPLPGAVGARIAALWEEYEAATTPAARAAKALDKLETILQHTEGLNPPDFDYRFNLAYGRRFTESPPLVAALRALLDDATERRARDADRAAGGGARERDGA